MQSIIVWADIGNTSIKWLSASAVTNPFGSDIDAQIKTTALKNPADFIGYLTSNQAIVHISCTLHNCQGVKLISQLRESSAKVYAYQQLEDSFNLSTNYDRPKEYGIDRYFSNFAIVDKRSTVVVDWGTAITVDAWQTEQQHQGGWIFAGQELYLNAFQKLQLSHQASVQTDLAKDTAKSIGNGYANLLMNWLNNLPQHSASMIGFEVERFIMTGNGYQAYQARLVKNWQFHKNLALKGLIKHCQ